MKSYLLFQLKSMANKVMKHDIHFTYKQIIQII